MYSYRPHQQQRQGPARQAPSAGSGRAPSARSGQALRGYVLPPDGQRSGPRFPWRRLLLALVPLAMAGGSAAAYFSPLLRVQDVQVVGVTNIDPQAVRGLAAVEDKSMLHPPLGEAEERIASTLPLVKAVQAQRRWPHTVRIQVQERQPWGYWQAADETYVVDSEGVVLEGVAPPEGAPTIVDRTPDQQLALGDRVDAETMHLAVELSQVVPQRLGELQVMRFDYDRATGLTAATSADYLVVLGDAQNLEYKLTVWQAMEERLGRQAMAGHVLDLRFGDRPSFR